MKNKLLIIFGIMIIISFPLKAKAITCNYGYDDTNNSDDWVQVFSVEFGGDGNPTSATMSPEFFTNGLNNYISASYGYYSTWPAYDVSTLAGEEFFNLSNPSNFHKGDSYTNTYVKDKDLVLMNYYHFLDPNWENSSRKFYGFSLIMFSSTVKSKCPELYKVYYYPNSAEDLSGNGFYPSAQMSENAPEGAALPTIFVNQSYLLYFIADVDQSYTDETVRNENFIVYYPDGDGKVVDNGDGTEVETEFNMTFYGAANPDDQYILLATKEKFDEHDEADTHGEFDYCNFFENFTGELQDVINKNGGSCTGKYSFSEIYDNITNRCNNFRVSHSYSDAREDGDNANPDAKAIGECLKNCSGLRDYVNDMCGFESTDSCNSLGSKVMTWIYRAIKIIRYAVPALLIILSILDWIKAIASESDDEMKKVTTRFAKRLIAAALIFLIPFVLDFILRMFSIPGFNADNPFCTSAN